ncbi:GPW/gp25 family protein [Novosphingobium colocasiae]|uniref:GPW/gp25 family protein n=1 Tax=Novosphingobium colocasiae TaxID=1256513 RepID=UPI0035AF4538
MAGMSRTTGTVIDGLDSIRESIADILGTPIGTRVGRRDYGSFVPELIDQPMTGPNILRIYAASALATARWEDRVRLRRVTLVAGSRPGAATLNIDADRKGIAPAAARITLALPL